MRTGTDTAAPMLHAPAETRGEGRCDAPSTPVGCRADANTGRTAPRRWIGLPALATSPAPLREEEVRVAWCAVGLTVTP